MLIVAAYMFALMGFGMAMNDSPSIGRRINKIGYTLLFGALLCIALQFKWIIIPILPEWLFLLPERLA